jgi:hypothetical protein
VTGLWFSPISSTNKTDHHDITEILLKVALNTINPNQTNHIFIFSSAIKRQITPNILRIRLVHPIPE